MNIICQMKKKVCQVKQQTANITLDRPAEFKNKSGIENEPNMANLMTNVNIAKNGTASPQSHLDEKSNDLKAQSKKGKLAHKS